MSLTYRRPRSDEIPAFFRVSLEGYGMAATPQEIAHEQLVNEIDRSYGALDDDQWVAGSGAFSFELTLPGGATVPAAGITMVGVAPTHRRRGILTAMMHRLHDDAVERGEPIAILTASEASIYRRFGYGVATEAGNLRIPTDAVRFDPPLTESGTFTLLDPHDDLSEVAAVYDKIRPHRSGWVSRNTAFWEQVRDDPESARDGRTPLRAVLRRDARGIPDGYATWRIAIHEFHRVAEYTVHIEELCAMTADGEADLWRFLAGIDLATSLVWQRGPLEPSIRRRLVECRQLRTEERYDLVWARILDVPAVLTARTYSVASTQTLAVVDRHRPETGGTFRLVTSPEASASRCERIADEAVSPADLTLDIADLSSISLGAIAPSELAAAGRVLGTPSTLGHADAVFPVRPASFCPIEF